MASNLMPEEKKQAYNLRTRKLQPQVFDSDSEDDFQAPSIQREEGSFLMIT